MHGRKEMDMLTENYCDECDEVVHAVFDDEDFRNHRVGSVKCPKCGHIIMPCNECENRAGCGNCPWASCHPEKAMSDEAFVRYLKDEEPDCFGKFLDGSMGEKYRQIAKSVA